MNEQQATNSHPGDVKTCPACGGTWPAERTHCLACGASLAGIPTHPPEDEPHDAPLDWRWLDAMAPEVSEEAEPPSGATEKKSGPGWLARLLGRQDKDS